MSQIILMISDCYCETKEGRHREDANTQPEEAGSHISKSRGILIFGTMTHSLASIDL